MARFFLFPFAEDGDRTPAVPNTDPGGAVNYESGFGVDYQRVLGIDPLARPIPRNEFNSLMYDITLALRQYQTLGVPDFVTTFDNGGTPFPYDIFAVTRYDGGGGFQVYESLVGSNTALPSDVTKWRVISGTAQAIQPGTVIEWAGLTAPVGYLECDGSAVSRSTYASLFANITATQTGTLTNGLPGVTGLSDTSRFRVGMKIEGTNIPSNTTILAIPTGTTLTMSANATGGGAQSIRFYPWGNGNGTTTFNVPDDRQRATLGAGGTPIDAVIDVKVGAAGGSATNSLTATQIPNLNVSASCAILTGANSAGPVPPSGAMTASGAPTAGTLTVTGGTTNTGGLSGAPHSIMQPSNVKLKCIKT